MGLIERLPFGTQELKANINSFPLSLLSLVLYNNNGQSSEIFKFYSYI